MTLGLLLKLLHILAAFWMISGVVGRDFTFWRAARTTDVHAVHALLHTSDFFERWAVIPVSMAVLVLGVATAWIQRWPMFGVLQGANTNWLFVSLVMFLGVTAAIPLLRLIPRRQRRAQALEAAMTQGKITAELTAALNDRVVTVFRAVELVVLVVIIGLMAAKPF